MTEVPPIPGPHRIRYQQELRTLEESVLGGIDLVVEQLDRVTEALEHQDVELAGMKSATPAGWKEEAPTSTMRMAQFRLPKAEGDADGGSPSPVPLLHPDRATAPPCGSETRR